jgi:hypothetical protein
VSASALVWIVVFLPVGGSTNSSLILFLGHKGSKSVIKLSEITVANGAYALQVWRVAVNSMVKHYVTMLFILTANGFLPGGSVTAIRHNTQVTHRTKYNTLKQITTQTAQI